MAKSNIKTINNNYVSQRPKSLLYSKNSYTYINYLYFNFLVFFERFEFYKGYYESNFFCGDLTFLKKHYSNAYFFFKFYRKHGNVENNYLYNKYIINFKMYSFYNNYLGVYDIIQ